MFVSGQNEQVVRMEFWEGGEGLVIRMLFSLPEVGGEHVSLEGDFE